MHKNRTNFHVGELMLGFTPQFIGEANLIFI